MLEIDLWRVHDGWKVSSLNISGKARIGELHSLYRLVRSRRPAHPIGLGQSDILGEFVTMRWMMIGLLVSLGMLLFAAGGLARHIWLERRRSRQELLPAPAPEPGQETGQEP
jgi:hypothetical protein